MFSAAIMCIVSSIGLTSGDIAPSAIVDQKFFIKPAMFPGGKPLAILLPEFVPYAKGSVEAHRFWYGYIEGYEDWVRPRFFCRTGADYRATEEFKLGYQAGDEAARMLKPRKPGR